MWGKALFKLKKWHVGGYKCYMQKKGLKELSEKYIFYDFETTLDNECKHVVNCCIAYYFTGKEHIFNTTDEFCKWVFTKQHKDYTVIAHYGKGYDCQFVEEWLVAHGVKPDVVFNGQKILQLEAKRDHNIRFIDSISFTTQPLKDFPKTFGLTELAKGYFPHEFNRPENQDYIGKYPHKKFYGYNQMKKEDRKKFDAWHEAIKNQAFNFN